MALLTGWTPPWPACARAQDRLRCDYRTDCSRAQHLAGLEVTVLPLSPLRFLGFDRDDIAGERMFAHNGGYDLEETVRWNLESNLGMVGETTKTSCPISTPSEWRQYADRWSFVDSIAIRTRRAAQARRLSGRSPGTLQSVRHGSGDLR